MTKEEKQLLLKDLVARICYKVCAKQYYSVSEDDFIIEGIIGEQIYAAHNSKISMTYPVEKIKPYLRPMLSMTEEEVKEFAALESIDVLGGDIKITCVELSVDAIDWLNKKMFDYRGLIPMGLALEAPKDMYNFK